jgi:hypothetical protein
MLFDIMAKGDSSGPFDD